jgi:glucan phosphoethanolaminetransferase (alkaline phosphatase superfamily)
MDDKAPQINYLYFGALFTLFSILTTASLFSKENLNGSLFFFLLYALTQVTLEVLLFILASSLIRRFLGKVCFALFIGATFSLLILHVIDCLMDRILDLSAWETINVFVLNESFDNFIYLLDASGISRWTWVLIFATLGSIPFLGIFLYKMSEYITQKKPLSLHYAFLGQILLCMPAGLLFWDFSASKILHPDAYTSFIKALPWKTTFLQPESTILAIPHPQKAPFNEEKVQELIAQDETNLSHKPNIYLFIVESLREDAITQEIAPHLHQFKNENMHFDTALSNGNGTHLSWFSIFHSQFPQYWKMAQDTLKIGSPALQLLKKWGYQLRVYSSAQLGYYGMDKLMFGNELQLLDASQTFHHIPPLNAADTDAAALTKMQQDILENPSLQEGQLFIIFWDCTHFDYSWPKEWTPKFTPFAKEFAYFKAFQSQKTIDAIKKRYWNSVNYMDTLFGKFLEHLPKKQEAIVLFTGDHGEEFFEHGHLFHNSHLTKEQTNVPLYFKFGNEKKPIGVNLVSQMDIFPSLIAYLSNTQPSFLEGNSIFHTPKRPFALTARFNAGLSPYEFFIHNGKYKLIAQFENQNQILNSKQLRIISLRIEDDKSIPNLKENIIPWVEKEFGQALHYLFGPIRE